MRLIFSASFAKKLQKLIKKNTDWEYRVNKTIKLIKNNPKHPSLKLHKLKNTEVVSAYVNMSVRILFLQEEDVIFFIDIGTHEEVY
ncbi:MAG: plasmid stabilization protein [Patescibacteria group bacterium]